MNDNLSEYQITVAVWMVTYNHESYISQAVESVVNQKTNYKYKLFLGEDCSTDKTREICIRLKEKYPSKIELFLQSKNVGGTKNGQDIYKLCINSGAKYIALCEGDDYWSDPLKIQKQVGFLEKHNDVSLCFHASFIDFTNSKDVIRPLNISEDCYFETEQIILSGGGLTPTASMMFQGRYLKEILKPQIASKTAGDFVLTLYLSLKGKVYYMNDIMSVYLKNNQTSYTNTRRSVLFEIKYKYYVVAILNRFNSDTKFVYWRFVLRKMFSLLIILIYRLLFLRWFAKYRHYRIIDSGINVLRRTKN
jgi:glycosyltransferase involved in cell wall biosynthesis